MFVDTEPGNIGLDGIHVGLSYLEHMYRTTKLMLLNDLDIVETVERQRMQEVHSLEPGMATPTPFLAGDCLFCFISFKSIPAGC